MNDLAKRRQVFAGLVIVVALAAGSGLARHVDALIAVVLCSPVLFVVLAWALLTAIGFPKAHWAALRACLPTLLFLSQMPYLGFVLLPFEILASGALVGNRTNLKFWKAACLMGAARLLAIAALEPWYLKDLLAW